MAPSEAARVARIACAVLVALALPSFVACNSILGISDYTNGECPGASCADGSVAPADGGPDVLEASLGARGADPVSWAQWPMPNYGDAGPGQPPRQQVLVAVGDTVRDVVTQLVWSSKLLPTPLKATDAEAECAKLLAGPWRAPKRIELVTLLDYSRTELPYIDVAKFPTFNNDVVWTTSEVRPFVAGKVDQAYWVVNFTTGAVEQLRGDRNARVLCVRAK